MSRNALLFVLIAIAQLAVPAWMLLGHERVRSEGDVFLFKTAPVDPRDPFRGEYVQLNFEAANGSWAAPDTSTGNYTRRRAYALLVADGEGYAQITSLMREEPGSGAFIPVFYYTFGEGEHSVTQVELPFDRYYLEEGDGPKTEELLTPDWSNGTPTTPMPAHAVVHVLNGESVITDLVVGGRSIHEWLKDPPQPVPSAPSPTSVPSGS